MRSHSVRAAIAFSFCLLQFSSRGNAQDVWTLSTADFKTEQVALQTIGDDGVTVVPVGQTQPRLVPAAAFLQLDRSLPPVERAATYMLHLATGDRIGGAPVKVENDRLTWTNAAVGELIIPLTQLIAITKPGQAPDPGKRTEDVVMLANGDSVRGIVTSLEDGRVRVKSGTDPEPLAVPMEAVVSVHFATAAQPPPGQAGANGPRLYRVRLDDGSSVVGTSLALADGKLSLAISGGEAAGAAARAAARPLALERVTGVEQVNGPVSWLNSVTPAEDVQIPFVASEQPLWRTRADVDVAGDPFVIGGHALRRGLGVHAYSRLVYPLDGTFKAFRTRYGINDSLVRADVAVRILLGDDVVHEAKNVRAGVLSPVVVIELGDAKRLVLEVDYGQGIDVEDRLNWIEPALLRELPKKEQPTSKPAAEDPKRRPASGAADGADQQAAPVEAGAGAQPATVPVPAPEQ